MGPLDGRSAIVSRVGYGPGCAQALAPAGGRVPARKIEGGSQELDQR